MWASFIAFVAPGAEPEPVLVQSLFRVCEGLLQKCSGVVVGLQKFGHGAACGADAALKTILGLFADFLWD